MVAGTYTADLAAKQAYVGGNIVFSKVFKLTINGLATWSDSSITVKSVIDPVFNTANIVNLINKGAGEVDMSKLSLLVDINNFPSGYKLTVKDDKADFNTGLYTATLVADKSHKDGNLLYNSEFKISAAVTKWVDDSTLTTKTTPDAKLNLNNIKDLINPGNTGSVNATNLALLCDITSFPSENKFTVTNDIVDVAKRQYSATFTASHSYVDSIVVYNKVFQITVTSLIERPDSIITTKVSIPEKFSSTNIVNLVNPNRGGTASLESLNLLCDLTNFPTTYSFSVTNDTANPTTGIYTADFTTNQAYVGGNLVTKTFKITVSGLVARPQSTITIKNVIDPTVNLTNIVKLINPLNNGQVDPTNLAKVFEMTNFPSGTTFTIEKDVADKIKFRYSARIIASTYHLNGEKLYGGKFDVVVNGLKERPDSKVVPQLLTQKQITTFFERLAVGEEADKGTLGRLIDLNEFPIDNTFIINSIDIDDPDHPSFTFTPAKVYKDGNIVPYNSLPIFAPYNVTLIPQPEPVPPADNTGLIIGISAGLGVLVLIVAGLLIWKMRKKQNRPGHDSWKNHDSGYDE